VSSARRQGAAGAAFILAGATIIQCSSAVVVPVMHHVAPSAASAWRFLFGALGLLAIGRPSLSRWTKEQWRAALFMGAAVAFMNFCFYQSIVRLPLGTAVTVEFMGPLSVAVLSKRTRRHVLFAVCAAVGVVLLARPGGHVTLAGLLFGLGSAVGWAMYIFASKRVGGTTNGVEGLAVAMAIAALLTLPFALGSWSRVTGHVDLWGRLALVALMALIIGFALELSALRRLSPAVAGVLMAFDPAVAFLFGFLILGQHATVWVLAGLACVVVAGIGVTVDQGEAVVVAIEP
jgi:inner membrane transporter RhtA